MRAAGRPADFPPPGPPEVAFAGRSNVGKSSAINALLGRRSLARTSKTPGRTQTINFYEMGAAARIVDLPGYGYARVPKPLREQWRQLVGSYLQDRPSLAGVVLVMDARHPLTDLDAQLLAWLGRFPTLALLSKADKLSRREQELTLKECASRLADAPHVRVALFSSTTHQGLEEARGALAAWLLAERNAEPAGKNKKPPVKGI
ncbi:MAG TPA: ribosome biogenesis GTP-binding protein YihA/YsxC [Burkholderiales bacterium]|nr:ribosome biogenesis GTP-binding protein YihA/YsxC [Burkholderiales bacterium]